MSHSSNLPDICQFWDAIIIKACKQVHPLLFFLEILQNFLAWISDNPKTVWQGESGELETVCWFFKPCPLDFIKVFLRCKLLDLTVCLTGIQAYSIHIFSFIKLCMNKDNLLVPLLCATPISVCQMRKSLKLSVRIEF